MNLAQHEKKQLTATAEFVRKVLIEHEWRLMATAATLGVTPIQLRRLIRKLGLQGEYTKNGHGRGRPTLLVDIL